MKLTKTQLKEIIEEELSSALQSEGDQLTEKFGDAKWVKAFDLSIKHLLDVLAAAHNPETKKKARIIKSMMRKAMVNTWPEKETLFAPEKPATPTTFTAPEPDEPTGPQPPLVMR